MSTTPPALTWKSLAPGPAEGSATVAAQPTLEHLPVPKLPSTLDGLRRSLAPLAQSKKELESTLAKVDAFEKSNLANELQDRLEKRQRETVHWLEEWWDSGAYMGYRDSVRNLIDIPYSRH